MSLKFISLNVNGIRDNSKRDSIFHWLKQQNVHVSLLHENIEDIDRWLRVGRQSGEANVFGQRELN